jgi:hypothetical protein
LGLNRDQLDLVDTTDFSRVEFQLRPTMVRFLEILDWYGSSAGRLKLKLHATEVGGISRTQDHISVKLKLHTAEAGGIFVFHESLKPGENEMKPEQRESYTTHLHKRSLQDAIH